MPAGASPSRSTAPRDTARSAPRTPRSSSNISGNPPSSITIPTTCWQYFGEHAVVSDNRLHGADVPKALGSITAPTIILPGQTDSYFPPTDSQREAELIPGAECRPIPSIWGHMCLWNPADAPFIDTALRDALGEV